MKGVVEIMSVRTDLAVEMVDEEAHRLPKGISRKLRKSSVCTITEIIVEDEMAGLKIENQREDILPLKQTGFPLTQVILTSRLQILLMK
jgi:hypothetical protein